MGDRGFFTDNIRVKDTTTPTKEFLISMATANGLPPPSQDDLEKITERYQNTYIAQMKRQYGFTDNTMMQLHSEFQIMSTSILATIENDEAFGEEYGFYKKYLETYPYLYFSLIPREVVESRLAAKCVEENSILRIKLAEMNKSLGDLINCVSVMQEQMAIPPIAKVVFESIPDPHAASTGEYHDKYGNGIDIYHSVFVYLKKHDTERLSQFLLSPVEVLNQLTPDDTMKMNLDKNDTSTLISMLSGLTAGKGCTPTTDLEKDTYNTSTGVEPPISASKCGEGAVRLGNPRNEGATKTYVVKKGENGKVAWERLGQ